MELATVAKSSPLGGIQGSDSLFEIYTEGYGDHPMVIQGAGAGAEVTARGVFSDAEVGLSAAGVTGPFAVISRLSIATPGRRIRTHY